MKTRTTMTSLPLNGAWAYVELSRIWWQALQASSTSNIPTLHGGMNMDEEFETPEEARRHRQLQLERYFLWLNDLDDEYRRLLLRIGDLTEDWPYTSEGVRGNDQPNTGTINRLIEILQTWRGETDAMGNFRSSPQQHQLHGVHMLHQRMTGN